MKRGKNSSAGTTPIPGEKIIRSEKGTGERATEEIRAKLSQLTNQELQELSVVVYHEGRARGFSKYWQE